MLILQRRLLGWTAAISAIAALTILVWIAAHVDSGQDLVLLRNSLIMHVAPAGSHKWTPATVPDDYLVETRDTPEALRRFAAVASGGVRTEDDFGTALALADALVSNRTKGLGPIQSDTLTALRRITTEGAGYCADYTQVFNALARAEGLSVREWGMAFDGYSGDGHAFNEIWDRKRQQWVFVDSFFSFYVSDPTGRPLSAIEFRSALVDGKARHLTIVPINPSKFGFKGPKNAIAYYERGAARFFLIWGNNVLAYDENVAVRTFGRFSRSAEQIAGIVAGVQPELVIPKDLADEPSVEQLFRLRALLALLATCVVMAFTALIILRIRKT
jgi:hypothetical protein